MPSPRVTILLAEADDRGVAERALEVLGVLGVPASAHVASPYQAPERVRQLVADSPAQVLVAIGASASGLAAMLAALTMRPVIHVPTGAPSPAGGSTALGEPPPGSAVVAVGAGRGEDAALAAAAILSLADERIQGALAAHREEARRGVAAADEELQRLIGR